MIRTSKCCEVMARACPPTTHAVLTLPDTLLSFPDK
jgi:hypothetical protein